MQVIVTERETMQHSEEDEPSVRQQQTPNNNDKVVFTPSLTLENTGSVARDHLASERTFLAYVRTSLAIASAGVGMSIVSFNSLLTFNEALVQLFTISSTTSTKKAFARPLGATIVLFGLLVLTIGTVPYLQ